jgi:MoxR-like ATPase
MANEWETIETAISNDVPVMIWGPPGIGKTSRIYQIAERLGMHAVVVIGSIREPSDFGGLPYYDGKSVKLNSPSWAEELNQHGNKGLLVLDELTTNVHSVQAAMLRVVFDRVVGDTPIKDCRIVAAGNPAEYAANGQDLNPAFANRFVHVDVEPVLGDFVSWSSKQTGSNSQALSMICGFLHKMPDLLFSMPKEDLGRSRHWPSPRSWEMASKMMNRSRGEWNSDRNLDSLASAVGFAAALEFHTWLKANDLQDPEELIQNPNAWKIPSRSDLVWASVTGVCSVIRQNVTVDRWVNGWKLIERLAKKQADVAAAVAVLMADIPAPKGAKMPNELDSLFPVMKAAGIIK